MSATVGPNSFRKRVCRSLESCKGEVTLLCSLRILTQYPEFARIVENPQGLSNEIPLRYEQAVLAMDYRLSDDASQGDRRDTERHGFHERAWEAFISRWMNEQTRPSYESCNIALGYVPGEHHFGSASGSCLFERRSQGPVSHHHDSQRMVEEWF